MGDWDIGDIIWLKIGGPGMCVTELKDDTHTRTVWFDCNNQLQSFLFKNQCLTNLGDDDEEHYVETEE